MNEPEFNELMKASPAFWVEQSHIKLACGDEYEFSDHMYLIKPMVSQARLKCVEKATQLGFSETFILDSLHSCISGLCRQGVAYIFPNDTDMKTFVQSRFNPLIKDNYDSIGRHVKDTDTTYFKRVGSSNLYFDGGRMNQVTEGGQLESAAMRGKSYDKIVIDEFDLMNEGILEKAEGRLEHSSVKAMTVISNPTDENHHVDRLFKKSTQEHWFRRCDCGVWTCSDEEFPNLITKKGCHCSKCGAVLGYKGQWVSPFTDRKFDLTGPDAQDWEGFQISQLNSRTSSPWVILQKYLNPENGDLTEFWKLRMGRAFTPKENRLTPTEVYDCCGNYIATETSDIPTAMGVDVGKDRYHYVVGYRTGKEKYEVIKVGCETSFDNIMTIALRLKVRSGVVDIRPYEAEARRFQKEAGFRVFLCQYGENPIQDIVWDDDRRIVKVFRTGIFDTTHHIVVAKKVRFPYRNAILREFAEQYCDPYKVKVTDKQTGETKYRYDSSGNDHYRNAMNYFYIAASNMRISHVENLGRKTKLRAIHETVRI